MSNGYQTERLPQKSECREDSEGSILESASTFAYRVLKEIEALAGTTACKSVQLVRLKQWAQEQGRWFDDRTQFGDNLTPFFERIKAHNSYFPDCSYCLVGFAENRDGNVCAVLVQPFIAEARLATEQEIHDEFIRLGFHSEDNGGYYTNNQHDIFDAVDGNVLVDDDGHLYFIDTIIFKSGTGGQETYNSLSPRASKK